MTLKSVRITVLVWISLVVGGALALAACTTQKKDIFPQDLAPMTTVYDQHFAGLRTRGLDGARSKLHASGEPNVPVAPEGTDQPEGKNKVSQPGEGALQPVAATREPQTVNGHTLNLEGYTRSALSELNVLFPLLPNPTLVMYVYPHLAEERAGVPGYVTQFRLYARDEYALPGEVPGEDANP
jgi:conjugative transfer region lipoprotein (TIGR03751 family)